MNLFLRFVWIAILLGSWMYATYKVTFFFVCALKYLWKKMYSQALSHFVNALIVFILGFMTLPVFSGLYVIEKIFFKPRISFGISRPITYSTFIFTHAFLTVVVCLLAGFFTLSARKMKLQHLYKSAKKVLLINFLSCVPGFYIYTEEFCLKNIMTGFHLV